MNATVSFCCCCSFSWNAKFCDSVCGNAKGSDVCIMVAFALAVAVAAADKIKMCSLLTKSHRHTNTHINTVAILQAEKTCFLTSIFTRNIHMSSWKLLIQRFNYRRLS